MGDIATDAGAARSNIFVAPVVLRVLVALSTNALVLQALDAGVPCGKAVTKSWAWDFPI